MALSSSFLPSLPPSELFSAVLVPVRLLMLLLPRNFELFTTVALTSIFAILGTARSVGHIRQLLLNFDNHSYTVLNRRLLKVARVFIIIIKYTLVNIIYLSIEIVFIRLAL